MAYHRHKLYNTPQLNQLEGTETGKSRALLWLVLNNAFYTMSANMSAKGMNSNMLGVFGQNKGLFDKFPIPILNKVSESQLIQIPAKKLAAGNTARIVTI